MSKRHWGFMFIYFQAAFAFQTFEFEFELAQVALVLPVVK